MTRYQIREKIEEAIRDYLNGKIDYEELEEIRNHYKKIL